jgi:hypothetical protein
MAVNLSGKHASFINRSITAAVQLKAAYDQMLELREEWDSLAYSTGITDADFVSNNVFLNAAMLQAFYVSQGNLVTFWTSGNGTNICNMIP